MLRFDIYFNATKESDVEILKNCLVEFDSSFKDDEITTHVEVEELYGHMDATDELINLAMSVAKALPECSFTIDGCVDCSMRSGEYQDFLIEYSDGKLTSKESDWYVYMCADDYETYEEFCDDFLDDEDEPRFTEEQFEAFLEDQYFILDSGEGECVKKVPLDNVREIPLEQQMNCPVCGESLFQGVPICEDSDGVKYHIWCAEEAGKETEIVY